MNLWLVSMILSSSSFAVFFLYFELFRKEFEPTKYFNQLCRVDEKSPDGGAVWLNRKHLRQFESALKDRFIQWMNEDKTKIDKIFERLENDVSEEFEKRSKPFNMVSLILKFFY